MAAGRPTKYKPSMGKKARDLLANGYSNRVVAGLLGIDESTFYDWLKLNPRFTKYISEGRAQGEKHYIDCADRMIQGGKGNAQALMFMMKNIYRWSDNPVIDEAEEKDVTVNFIVKKDKREDDE